MFILAGLAVLEQERLLPKMLPQHLKQDHLIVNQLMRMSGLMLLPTLQHRYQ